ncbi:MAG: hypothetical protein KDD69_10445 [Bdellovibrionales bacterium]|nr:hypothetical protein [Bdellovibrionales bacterium]
MNVNEERFFQYALALRTRQVRVGLSSSGELLEGEVVNAMFDSFLLRTPKGNRVVRFEEITFLDAID